MPAVAISTSSKLAAESAAEVARAGGNAVDVAIAGSIVSSISEPGMVSLGAGGYITIWPGEGDPVSIDGGVEMPGRFASPEQFGRGGEHVKLDYIGGFETIVGAGSVATPGAVAAWAEASRRYGKLPWRELLQPALAVARDGFPMQPASHFYLSASHLKIFGRDPESFAALHDDDGQLLAVGETIRMPGLAGSLDQLAAEGARAFYAGDLGQVIAQCVQAGGGLLDRRDLAAYQARVDTPIRFDHGPWQAATAAPSSIGGVLLAAMMQLAEPLKSMSGWSPEWIARVIAVQNAVYGYRAQQLDGNLEFEQAALEFLEQIDAGLIAPALGSASTVHTSTVDDAGLACAVTISAGYGSGVMPPGSGFWLNNCLGELELNCGRFHTLPPGARLLSCMAPTVARHRDGQTLSLGSPGSARIITAQFQTLLNAWFLEMDLEQAIKSARLHVEPAGEVPTVSCEPGLEMPGQGIKPIRFTAPNTYFGGVGIATLHADGRLAAVTDPRRSGATLIVG